MDMDSPQSIVDNSIPLEFVESIYNETNTSILDDLEASKLELNESKTPTKIFVRNLISFENFSLFFLDRSNSSEENENENRQFSDIIAFYLSRLYGPKELSQFREISKQWLRAIDSLEMWKVFCNSQNSVAITSRQTLQFISRIMFDDLYSPSYNFRTLYYHTQFLLKPRLDIMVHEIQLSYLDLKHHILYSPGIIDDLIIYIKNYKNWLYKVVSCFDELILPILLDKKSVENTKSWILLFLSVIEYQVDQFNQELYFTHLKQPLSEFIDSSDTDLEALECLLTFCEMWQKIKLFYSSFSILSNKLSDIIQTNIDTIHYSYFDFKSICTQSIKKSFWEMELRPQIFNLLTLVPRDCCEEDLNQLQSLHSFFTVMNEPGMATFLPASNNSDSLTLKNLKPSRPTFQFSFSADNDDITFEDTLDKQIDFDIYEQFRKTPFQYLILKTSDDFLYKIKLSHVLNWTKYHHELNRLLLEGSQWEENFEISTKLEKKEDHMYGGNVLDQYLTLDIIHIGDLPRLNDFCILLEEQELCGMKFDPQDQSFVNFVKKNFNSSDRRAFATMILVARELGFVQLESVLNNSIDLILKTDDELTD